MDSIVITRPVTVKVILTEEYRNDLLKQCDITIRKNDIEIQRLEFQLKKALAEAEPAQAAQIRHQFDLEKKKRIESKQKIAEQVQALKDLPLGTELIQGRVESMVEVRVGDDWRKLAMVEVVVKDGKVVEIREGQWGESPPQ
ncbi:YlqD family protein [Desulforudis sp. 1088]|uniref:YlqD family protein n=1 Tax=unclassified Candidatus Desulforudis TaxID=2635950 RepID=UPI003488C2B1